MGILIRFTLVLVTGFGFLLAGSSGVADPLRRKSNEDLAIEEANRNLCLSTEEYIKTLKFLRDTKEFKFQEAAARTMAEQVSQGCDGAAERFSQILVLLKTVGFSENKSVEMALEFAATPPDVQKNFLEIFTKAFLKEFFDYEFRKAMHLALELSKDYKGNPVAAREDFIELARFCKDSKKLSLPLNFCTEYAVRVAKLSQHYPDGVAKPFLNLFSQLRERKDLTLDVKLALEISYGILKSGPKAPQNFFEAFEFASTDMKLTKKNALEFALRLADQSYVGDEPPIMHFRSGASPFL